MHLTQTKRRECLTREEMSRMERLDPIPYRPRGKRRVVQPHRNRILKADELAALLQCSTATIYREVASGNIPAFRIFRHYRFLESEIREWQRRKTQGA
jgi:excisionase family DNA binding protein